MTINEIKRGINRITGKEMILCEDCYGVKFLMINGINQKTGEKAAKLFDYLLKK